MKMRSKSVILYCSLTAALLLWLAAERAYKTENAIMRNDAAAQDSTAKMETAVFGGGCFWGVEHLFGRVPGVVRTKAGFMGGTVANPNYKRVCGGDTNHAEVVSLQYDPAKITYRKLAEFFFEIHDPTTPNRQGPDAGTQYRSVIFYCSDAQKQVAQEIIEQLDKSGKFKRHIVTQIVPTSQFWPAEEYHQKYFQKNPDKASCHFYQP